MAARRSRGSGRFRLMKTMATVSPFRAAIAKLRTVLKLPRGMKALPAVIPSRTIRTTQAPTLGSRISFTRLSTVPLLRGPADEVDAGVEEDPDRIDEVPVERRGLELRRGLKRQRVAHALDQQPGDQGDAYADVDGVEAGRDPVEAPEQHRLGRLEVVVVADEEVVLDVLGVLEALDHDEAEPEQDRGGEAPEGEAPQAGLRTTRGQHH